MSDKRVLFLDRDGVVNKRLIDDYVSHIEDFVFLPGVLDAIVKLKKYFFRIFIVTNQQGIGKGLMTEVDLERIHNFMLKQISISGGKVDAIYYCPHLRSDGCNCRKPNTGMYQQAIEAFPDVKDALLYMVGDTSTDMEFANNIGAVAVMIKENLTESDIGYNFVFPSLNQFAEDIHLVLV